MRGDTRRELKIISVAEDSMLWCGVLSLGKEREEREMKDMLGFAHARRQKRRSDKPQRESSSMQFGRQDKTPRTNWKGGFPRGWSEDQHPVTPPNEWLRGCRAIEEQGGARKQTRTTNGYRDRA